MDLFNGRVTGGHGCTLEYSSALFVRLEAQNRLNNINIVLHEVKKLHVMNVNFLVGGRVSLDTGGGRLFELFTSSFTFKSVLREPYQRCPEILNPKER